MAYICGDCRKEHPVPTREEDREGQPCVEALARDRDHCRAMLLAICKKYGPVTQELGEYYMAHVPRETR